MLVLSPVGAIGAHVEPGDQAFWCAFLVIASKSTVALRKGNKLNLSPKPRGSAGLSMVAELKRSLFVEVVVEKPVPAAVVLAERE